MPEVEGQSFERRMQRIEELLERIESSSDPVAQDAARQVVRTLLDLHAAALTKMLDSLEQITDGGSDLLESWRGDPLIGNVLLLHDLHPQDTEARVRRALDEVRPYLESHGGGIELLEASADGVRLRMQGSCEGHGSSMTTLKTLLENAIYNAAPEVATIEVEGLQEPKVAATGLVQLQVPGA